MKRRERKKPGTGGEGKYYRLVLQSKEQFVTFRYHDVGEKGGDLIRLAGKKSGGSWETQAWLINKDSAKVENGNLIARSRDVEDLLKTLGTRPRQIDNDVFGVTAKADIHTIRHVLKRDESGSAQSQSRQGTLGGKAKKKVSE